MNVRRFANWGSGRERKELCETILNELQACLKRPSPLEEGLEFICETDVERIWTELRVQSLSKGLNWDQPGLHQKARRDYKQILSILVWIRWDRWDDFKTTFLDHQDRNDAELPLGSDMRFLPQGMRHQFSRSQYVFIPVILVEESRSEVTVPEEFARPYRMPFVESVEIGNGATGVVTKELIAAKHFRYNHGNLNGEPIWVARKRIERGDTSGPISKNFFAEQGALTSFKQCLDRNDNIMLSLTTFTHDNYFNIISPLADLDLHKFLHGDYHDFEERQQHFTPFYLLAELSCLAGALNFLHHNLRLREKKIACAHLDFKPENILVKWSTKSDMPVGQWLVTDFGTARIKEPSEALTPGDLAPGDFLTHFSLTKAQRNPGPYQAPEVQPNKDRIVGRESDLWSFGCLLAAVLAFAIGGEKHVSGLARSRYHASQPNETKTDYFYTHVDGKAILKPTLTAWLNGLKTDKPDDKWIDKTLALIYKILVEQPPKRLSALAAQDELDVIRDVESQHLRKKCSWRKPEAPIPVDSPGNPGTWSHSKFPSMDQRLPVNQNQYPDQRPYGYYAPPGQYNDPRQSYHGGPYMQPGRQNTPQSPGIQGPYMQDMQYNHGIQQNPNMYPGHNMHQNSSQGQYRYLAQDMQYNHDLQNRQSMIQQSPYFQGQYMDQQRNSWHRQSFGQANSPPSVPNATFTNPIYNNPINNPSASFINPNLSPNNPISNGQYPRTSTSSSSPSSMPSLRQDQSRNPSIIRSDTTSWNPLLPSTTFPPSPNRSDESSSLGQSSMMADVSFVRLQVPEKSTKSAVCTGSTRVAFLSTAAVLVHNLGLPNQWAPKKAPKSPDPATKGYQAPPISCPTGYEWDLISLCADYLLVRAKNKTVKTDCKFFRYRCHATNFDPPNKEVWVEEPFSAIHMGASDSINGIANSVVGVSINRLGDALFALDSNLCYYSSRHGFHTLDTVGQVRRACFSSDGQLIFAWSLSVSLHGMPENRWYIWDAETSRPIMNEPTPRTPAERLGSGKNNLIFPFSRSFAAFEIPNRLYIIDIDSARRVTQMRYAVENVAAGVSYEGVDLQTRSQGLILVQNSPPRIVNLPLIADVQSSKASKSQKLQEGFNEITHGTAVISDMTGAFIMVSHPNGIIERRKVMS